MAFLPELTRLRFTAILVVDQVDWVDQVDCCGVNRTKRSLLPQQ